MAGLKIMISICEQFAAEYNLIFNGTKSKLLIFSKSNANIPDPCVKLNGDLIPKVDSATHLGNILHTKNEYECIEEGIRAFNRCVNMFIFKFKVCSPIIRAKLFQQYCMSLYGSQLWPLWNRNIGDLCTKWNIALRRVLDLPFRTHRDLLPLIAGQKPMEISLHCRLIKFYRTIDNSENSIVKYISNYCVTSPSSKMGANLRLISSRLVLLLKELLNLSLTKLKSLC